MQWAEEHIRKDVCRLNSKLAPTLTNTLVRLIKYAHFGKHFQEMAHNSGMVAVSMLKLVQDVKCPGTKCEAQTIKRFTSIVAHSHPIPV